MIKWLKAKRIYRFGGFSVDASSLLLRHSQEVVALTPKVFQTLVILLENRDRVVTKEELREQVWPGIFVEENALPQNIYLLRKALKDKEPDADYVESVPRRGYRFHGEVQVESRRRWLIYPAAAACVVLAVGLVWSIAWNNNRRDLRGTSNREAYDLYLLGRLIWTKRDYERMDQAAVYLRRAVAKDPNFARAWGALADLAALGPYPALEAKDAVRRALALDPNLAEAHASLGFIRMVHDWNWQGSEESFRRAIALDPRCTTAHQWFALHLALRGRFPEAEKQIEEGLRVEPVSVNLLHERCEIRYLHGDYASALADCRRVLEIDPVFRFANGTINKINARLGNYEALIRRFEEGARRRPDFDPRLESPFRKAYREGGRAGYWRALLEAAKNSDPLVLAQDRTELGDVAGAVDDFARAVETHSFADVFACVEPAFDPLRSNARFQALLQKICAPPSR